MKSGKIVKIIVFVFFGLFLSLYIADKMGYYEYANRRKTNLTNEQIKKFENDIKNGEKIDMNNYLDDIEIDYRNGLSKASTTIGNEISNFVKGGVKIVFKIINKMVEIDEN